MCPSLSPEDNAQVTVEERVHVLLLEAFSRGTEGLMLKSLDAAAAYQPSKRCDSWLKLKK